RGVASGFVVVSGHPDFACGPILDALPPGSATLVILMRLARRRALSHLLIARGCARATPTAVCPAAATAQGHAWIGARDAMSAGREDTDAEETPGAIVVGDVGSVGASIAAVLFQHPVALAASHVE